MVSQLTQSMGLFTNQKIGDLSALADGNAIAGFFKALGLVWAYQNMIYLAEVGLKTKREMKRMPSQYEQILTHFIENYDLHIDVATGRIFNPDVIGGEDELRDWQQAGHPMKRTAGNFPERMRRWKAIYDRKPFVVTRVAPKGQLKPGQTRKANLMMKTYKLDAVPEYEDIIRRRNERYPAAAYNVPWWFVMNYGTDGPTGWGYPETGGIHFVENAEKTIPFHLDRALVMYEWFTLDVLLTEQQRGHFDAAVQWQKHQRPYRKYETKYFDAVEVAQQLGAAF
jgi:hypothetical protein